MTLAAVANSVVLEVIDDGRGFDPVADQERPSLGILGMRERATELGVGQLDGGPLHETERRRVPPGDARGISGQRDARCPEAVLAGAGLNVQGTAGALGQGGACQAKPKQA